MTMDLQGLLLSLIILNLSFSVSALCLNFVARRTANKTDDAIARLINKIAKKFIFALDLISGNIKHK